MKVEWEKEIQNLVTEEVIEGIRLKVYGDRPRTMTETLENSASLYPEKVALVHGHQRITYRELLNKVHSLAYQFRHRYGIQKGDRVALLMMNGIPFVVGAYAALQVGAIVVPLSSKLKTLELKYMLQNSEAKLLITDLQWWSNVSEILDQTLVQHVLVYSDDRIPEGTHSLRQLWQEKAPEVVKVAVHEHDAALIMYTSGTTGRPKGAINTHCNVIHSAMNYALCLGLSSEDSTMVAVPLFHITGLVAQLSLFIYLGGKIVLMPMFKANEFLEILQEEKITHCIASPTVYTMTLMQPNYRDYDITSFRCVTFGGAPMPAETVKGLLAWNPNLELHNVYGSTETTSPVVIMPYRHQVRKLTAVGIAVPVGEAKVVDPGTREGLPCGEIGEILLKGPMVCKGYWKNEEATKHAFVNGWFSTGDLGMIDGEGFVSVMDRLKDMINRGGEKIYSVEVEDVLYSNVKIMEAAVVGVPDSTYGEAVKAYVVPRKGESLSEQEIKQWVADRMAKYKVPAYVEILDALPRNPNGKVIKKDLQYI